MNILRNFTGLVVALALVTGSIVATAVPARAQTSDELFRFLLGAATVAIIVSAFDDRTRFDHRYTGRVLPAQCRETYRVRGRNLDVYNAICLERAGMRNLPQYCMANTRTDRGHRRAYHADCLYNAGYQAERGGWRDRERERPRDRRAVLPSSCELTYRHHGQRISGYYGDCLRRAGLRNLPAQCSLTARLDGQRMTIFNAQCLADAGYRQERRGRR